MARLGGNSSHLRVSESVYSGAVYGLLGLKISVVAMVSLLSQRKKWECGVQDRQRLSLYMCKRWTWGASGHSDRFHVRVGCVAKRSTGPLKVGASATPLGVGSSVWSVCVVSMVGI